MKEPQIAKTKLMFVMKNGANIKVETIFTREEARTALDATKDMTWTSVDVVDNDSHVAGAEFHYNPQEVACVMVIELQVRATNSKLVQ